MYERIHVTTYDKWMEHENWCKEHWSPDIWANHEKVVQQREQERTELHKKFPYTVMVEGSYPEHDFAARWCWRNFGPKDGKCYEYSSEYPGCPLVLKTEYIESGTWKDKDGVVHSWQEKAYRNPYDHEHQGNWSVYWFGKTGYDYGIAEYCFKNEQDRDGFLAAVPTFTYGEKYEKEGD